MVKGLGYPSLAMAAALLVAAAPASAEELVRNGSFETGNFADWTQTGNGGFTGVTSWATAPDGSRIAYFGPIGSTGGISQMIPTISGETYVISFALTNLGGGTPNSFSALFGSQPLVGLIDAPAFDWTTYTISTVATSDMTSLVFAFQHDPSWYLLDSVSVSGATLAVPEPAGWTMLIAGFAMLGGVMRTRRRRRRLTVGYA